MRKTSVYLTDGELAALRRAARRGGCSQSHLIREGVRKVTSPTSPEPSTESTDEESKVEPPAWLTRQEELALALANARRSVAEIAGELRLSTTEALEVLGSVGAKLRYFSSPRTPGR